LPPWLLDPPLLAPAPAPPFVEALPAFPEAPPLAESPWVLEPQATKLTVAASSNATKHVVIDEGFMRVSFTARKWFHMRCKTHSQREDAIWRHIRAWCATP
jgi:hypothetical protein